MANLPQGALSESGPPKEAVISFRVHQGFKKAIDKGLIDRDMTLQEAGTRAFAQFFEIPVPIPGHPYPPPNGAKASVADWKRKRGSRTGKEQE